MLIWLQRFRELLQSPLSRLALSVNNSFKSILFFKKESPLQRDESLFLKLAELTKQREDERNASVLAQVATVDYSNWGVTTRLVMSDNYQRLRLARLRLGLSLKQASELVSMSISEIKNFEYIGYHPISSMTCTRYKQLLQQQELPRSLTESWNFTATFTNHSLRKITLHRLNSLRKPARAFLKLPDNRFAHIDIIRLTKSGLVLISSPDRIDRLWESKPQMFNHRTGSVYRHSVPLSRIYTF